MFATADSLNRVESLYQRPGRSPYSSESLRGSVHSAPRFTPSCSERYLFSSGKVPHFLEVGEKARARRAPSQPFLRLRAGMPDRQHPTRTRESRSGPRPSLGDFDTTGTFSRVRSLQRCLEAAAFFADRVIPGPCRGLLKRQPVKAGSIEYVRGGPAVQPVADIR